MTASTIIPNPNPISTKSLNISLGIQKSRVVLLSITMTYQLSLYHQITWKESTLIKILSEAVQTCNFSYLQGNMMQTCWIWKQNKLRGSSSAARLLLIQNDQFLNLISYHVDLKDENRYCLLFTYSSGSTLDWYSQAVVSEEFPEGLVNISRTNPWPFMGHEWAGSAVPHNEHVALTWQIPSGHCLYHISKQQHEAYSSWIQLRN